MKFFVEERDAAYATQNPSCLLEWAKLSGQTSKYISRRATMLVLFGAYSLIDNDFVLKNF